MKSLRTILVGGIIFLCLASAVVFRLEITRFLVNIRVLSQGFLDPSFNYEDFQKLKLENQGLRVELNELNRPTKISADRFSYLPVEIYSLYPFSDRGFIVINAGAEDGIKEGLPVLAGKGVVLGKIKTVKRTQSEVETIFDSGWRSSVAIGEKRTEALLKGGVNPQLELISKTVSVEEGDAVLNLSSELPLNLLIGNIKEVTKNEAAAWFTATLNLPYQLDQLEQVMVITNFP